MKRLFTILTGLLALTAPVALADDYETCDAIGATLVYLIKTGNVCQDINWFGPALKRLSWASINRCHIPFDILRQQKQNIDAAYLGIEVAKATKKPGETDCDAIHRTGEEWVGIVEHLPLDEEHRECVPIDTVYGYFLKAYDVCPNNDWIKTETHRAATIAIERCHRIMMTDRKPSFDRGQAAADRAIETAKPGETACDAIRRYYAPDALCRLIC